MSGPTDKLREALRRRLPADRLADYYNRHNARARELGLHLPPDDPGQQCSYRGGWPCGGAS